MRHTLRLGLMVGASVLALGASVLLARCGERVPPEHGGVARAPSGANAATLPPVPTRDQALADASAEPPLDTERSSEQALMAEAERVLARTPQQTLTLIETADRRFGSAVEARRKLEIEALVRLQRIGLAHSKADRFYRAFPDSDSIREIERRTGYHPRPTGPTQ
jgi:hypothetical protein